MFVEQTSDQMAFKDTTDTVEDILEKAKKVAAGETLASAGIDLSYMKIYAECARLTRDNREFLALPYPYEQGPAIRAFNGGFFEHKHWPLRLDIEKHPSLRAVAEYEANYINAAGYWMAFHESAIQLRQEALKAEDREKALKCDVWSQIAVRYGLRVTGLRCEFYRMAARDPVHAKLVMPTLERRYEVPAADDLQDSMAKLETHMSTQLMKAVATLAASNATKRSGGGKKGGSADGQ